MKVIDLLNKIANGEEVPKIIKKMWKYEWQYDENREEYTYMQETGERFDEDWLVISMLNDKVEIIEKDKKIEKININGYDEILDTTLASKINEIIDKLNAGVDKE